MGEIVIRGNAMMKGYDNDHKASSKAIRNVLFYKTAVVHPDSHILSPRPALTLLSVRPSKVGAPNPLPLTSVWRKKAF
jgi:acyl-CoA synthetase (AMP-forming)/AMP-acid ligase II